MAEQHAILSASSSNRWLHCTPSAKLALSFPRTSSKYAEAGTLAHSIGELKARKYFLEPLGAQEYQKRLQALKENPLYEKAMDGNTDAYLEYLKSQAMTYKAPPFVALEVRVDYSRYVPEAFGTADCIMIGENRMLVTDYKNGSGVPVEAEENPQMMLYALGALETYRPIYGDTVTDVHLAIVQPNVGEPKEWDITVEHLREWGEKVVKPAAALAWEGKGEFCPGPWCDSSFCPARATCTARAKKMLELEPQIGAAPEGWKDGTPGQKEAAMYAEAQEKRQLLTDAEIGDILARAQGLSKWISALEDYALSAILKGKEIPGFKAVLGRSSNQWAGGPDKAFETLKERGVEEAILWKREPITVAGLKKELGKKVFDEVSDGLVEKKRGSPTLAPESDRRKAYIPAEAAFTPVETQDTNN